MNKLFFTTMQVAIIGLIGSPAASALALGVNLHARKKTAVAVVVVASMIFALAGILFLDSLSIHPIDLFGSIFLQISILWMNYVWIDKTRDGESEKTTSRSWVSAAACCVAGVILVLITIFILDFFHPSSG